MAMPMEAIVIVVEPVKKEKVPADRRPAVVAVEEVSVVVVLDLLVPQVMIVWKLRIYLKNDNKSNSDKICRRDH
jgi:hypothetical protein